MNTKIDMKQWIMATLAVFVIGIIFALLQTKVILPAQPTAPDAQDMAQSGSMGGRVLVYLTRLITAGLFTFIFIKSSEGKSGIAHGARFGLGIGLLFVLPNFILGFEFSGLSSSTHAISKIVDLITSVLCGAVTAQLYKPAKA